MTSTYLVLNAVVGRAGQTLRATTGRAVIGVLACFLLSFSVLVVYDFAAARGFLGTAAEELYYRQSGPLGVLVGGRSESLVSTQAILDSPVLGHGSWAKDTKYVDLLSDRLASLGYEALPPDPADIGVIPAHSYLLGSWVEGGVLSRTLLIAIAALAVWLLLTLYSVR